MKLRLIAASALLGLMPLPVLAAAHEAEPLKAAPAEVARASCSSGDRPEPDDQLQGQVTAAERAAGFAGRSCNLRLVGAHAGPGGTYVGAARGRCAYYATKGEGVLVVDLHKASQPVVTATLRSPGMQRTWESLKVNSNRALLAATAYGSDAFDVYDIRDCRRPRLLASTRFPGTQGHEGEFAPDGRTYYITNRQHTGNANFGFLPVDLTDPRRPQALPRWDTPDMGQAHGLSLSDDGNRMYLTVPDGLGGPNRQATSGILILDVTTIQNRRAPAAVGVVSRVRWTDGGESQMTIPVRIGGRPHLIANDEWGSYLLDFGRVGCAAASRGGAAYGYPRVFDISDERRPRQVSTVRLQVQNPANCLLAVNDTAHLFSYSTHYCSVDRVDDPRLLGCGNFESGLRIFDIRDVTKPEEVAYWNPPARPGSTSEQAALGYTDVDWASSPPVFRLDRGEMWVQMQDNGVQVLRLSDSVLRELR